MLLLNTTPPAPLRLVHEVTQRPVLVPDVEPGSGSVRLLFSHGRNLRRDEIDDLGAVVALQEEQPRVSISRTELNGILGSSLPVSNVKPASVSVRLLLPDGRNSAWDELDEFRWSSHCN